VTSTGAPRCRYLVIADDPQSSPAFAFSGSAYRSVGPGVSPPLGVRARPSYCRPRLFLSSHLAVLTKGQN
jgi:hypothetical protein